MLLIAAMFRLSNTRRFGSWLVLAVFVLNAFWPLVSLANPAGSLSWMEICTSGGMRVIASGDTTPVDGERSGMQMPQCPLCAGFGGLDHAVIPSVTPMAMAPAGEIRPGQVAHPALLIAAFARAQPRAPPVIS